MSKSTLADWELDDEAGTMRQAMFLVDWNHDSEIIAVAGGVSGSVVGQVSLRVLTWEEQTLKWIGEQLQSEKNCPMLIIVDRQVWAIHPLAYRSTGFLLFQRCTVPVVAAVSLADKGLLGQVSLFPVDAAHMSSLYDQADAVPQDFFESWNRVLACFSNRTWPMPTYEAIPELLRLTRSVAYYAGLTLTELEVPCDAAEKLLSPVAYDLPMFSAMMLAISMCLLRCGIPHAMVAIEIGDEGVAVRLSASCREEADLLNKPEFAACCRLAERNCQIFDQLWENGMWQARLCAVRKDYALLGVKAKPDLK